MAGRKPAPRNLSKLTKAELIALVGSLQRRAASVERADTPGTGAPPLADPDGRRVEDFAGVASDWFWEMDKNLRFTYMSERWEEVTGLPMTAVIGKTRAEMGGLRAADKDKWRRHFRNLELRKPFHDFRYIYTDGTGKRHHWRISGRPIYDENGEFGGYRGTGNDETAEVEARDRAERAEWHLLEAIESMSDGFAVWDAEDRYVLCNDRYREIYPEVADLAVPGTRFETILREAARRGVYPFQGKELESFVAERLRQHAMPSCISEQNLINGRWVRISEHAIQDGGRVGVWTDITELKQREQALGKSEERLTDAIESISEGFVLFDADGRLVLCNSRYREFYPDLADLLVPGTQLEDLTRLAAERGQLLDTAGREEEWVRMRLQQFSTGRGTHEQRLRDGRWIMAAEYRTRDGNIVGIRSDITQRKRAEEDLRQALERADVANRAKTEFLANVSHELRTPLNSIIGFSEVLQNQMFGAIDEPRYLDYIGDINESGRHLLELINDILDISRIESGSLSLNEGPVDVQRLVSSCHRLVKERARTADVKLIVEVADPRIGLMADERQLKQILLNLLSNAIKFTPAGGTIRLSAEPNDVEEFTFTVSDTGIGIAPEDMELVLTPFGQADGSLSREFEGAGLGLPLSKKLTELHGGELLLASEPGAGTTITVRFPRKRLIRAQDSVPKNTP